MKITTPSLATLFFATLFFSPLAPAFTPNQYVALTINNSAASKNTLTVTHYNMYDKGEAKLISGSLVYGSANSIRSGESKNVTMGIEAKADSSEAVSTISAEFSAEDNGACLVRYNKNSGFQTFGNDLCNKLARTASTSGNTLNITITYTS